MENELLGTEDNFENENLIPEVKIEYDNNETVVQKVGISFLNKSKAIAIKKGYITNVLRYSIIFEGPKNLIPKSVLIDLSDKDIDFLAVLYDIKIPKGAKFVSKNIPLMYFTQKRGYYNEQVRNKLYQLSKEFIPEVEISDSTDS